MYKRGALGASENQLMSLMAAGTQAETCDDGWTGAGSDGVSG